MRTLVEKTLRLERRLDGSNYQIAAITALILLIPSVAFMLVIERFLRADVIAKIGG